MSSNSPSPEALPATSVASPIANPALTTSSDGHSSLPVLPSSSSQADPAVLLSSLPPELAAFLPPPRQGRLVEGFSRPPRRADAAGPSSSRATITPPPAHLGRPSYYDEAFEAEIGQVKRVWHQNDFDATFFRDFAFHQRSVLTFAILAMVASRLAHSGEYRTHVSTSKMEGRLAKQLSKLSRQIAAKDTKVTKANKKIEELSRSVGGLREEKDKAKQKLSSLKFRFEDTFIALRDARQLITQLEAQQNEKRASREVYIESLKAEAALFDNKARTLEGEVRSVKSELEALKETVETKREAAEGARIEVEEFKKLAEGAFFDGIRCAQWELKRLRCDHDISQMLTGYDATKAEQAFNILQEIRPDLQGETGASEEEAAGEEARQTQDEGREEAGSSN